MNKTYMDHTHPDAFLDYPLRPRQIASDVECPRCRGHGGWNLRLFAYPKPHLPDTPENRHLQHFRASCDHCNGWGYVSPKVTCQGHKWVHVTNLRQCLDRYRCSECGAITDVDSSG